MTFTFTTRGSLPWTLETIGKKALILPRVQYSIYVDVETWRLACDGLVLYVYFKDLMSSGCKDAEMKLNMTII